MISAPSEDWRPGFAKRAENFSDVCAQAEAWRWSPGETIARVAAAVLKGTPALSIPQRMTLLLYVEHLNQAAWSRTSPASGPPPTSWPAISAAARVRPAPTVASYR